MANSSDLLKDKRVLLGLAAVVLLGLGGTAAVMMSSGSGGGEEETASAPAPPPPAVPAAGGPATPAGAPSTPSAAPRATQTAQAPVAKFDTRTSFDDAPSFYGGGGGAAGPAGAAPAAPTGAPAAPAAGGGDAVNKQKEPLDPIRPGVPASRYRSDPFVSRLIPRYERPAAFNFITPIRVASIPPPPVPPVDPDPDIQFGPLQPVQRRVAGILYNGNVSAILETGQPGPTAQVDVVQPGQTVPSGIPGIPDLVVSAITPTQLTLRAEDGRTVIVPLSGAPGLANSLPGAGGIPGGGGPPGGFPGPGGFGGRGPGGAGGVGFE